MKHPAGKRTDNIFLFEPPDAFNNGLVKQPHTHPTGNPGIRKCERPVLASSEHVPLSSKFSLLALCHMDVWHKSAARSEAAPVQLRRLTATDVSRINYAATAAPFIYLFLQQRCSQWACKYKHVRTKKKRQRLWQRWVYFLVDNQQTLHVWWLNVQCCFTNLQCNGGQ